MLNEKLNKAFIITLLLLSCRVVFAQDIPIEPPTTDNSTSTEYSVHNKPDSQIVWHGMYTGLLIGYDITAIPNGSVGSFSSSASYHAGLEVCKMLSDHTGIVLGVLYRQYSYSYSYSNINPSSDYNDISTANRATVNDTSVVGGYSTSANYSFTYASIPILFRYSGGSENKISFFAQAGVMANILVGKSVSGTAVQTQYGLTQAPNTWWYDYSSTTTYSANINESNPDAATFTLAFQGEIGLTVPLSKNLWGAADYNFDINFMSCGTGKNDVVNFKGGSNGLYYFYGPGTYGTFNYHGIELKLIYRLGN